MKTIGSFKSFGISETGGSLKIARIAQHTYRPLQNLASSFSSLISSRKGEPKYFFTSKEET